MPNTDPLLREVMAYATAQNWDIARDLLLRNDKLLSERAEHLLHSTVVSMQFLGSSNPTAGALLQERESFLQRARAIGVPAAWAERQPQPHPSKASSSIDLLALPGLVGNWLDTRTFGDQRAFLASNLALLDPLTDPIMTSLIGKYAGQENERFLRASFVWLQRARQDGLDAGWQAFCREMDILPDPAEAERLFQRAIDWLGTQTYGDQHDYLATHPDLLDPHMDTIFDGLIRQCAGQKEEKFLRASQVWLQRARQDGLEVGWQAFQLMMAYDEPQNI